MSSVLPKSDCSNSGLGKQLDQRDLSATGHPPKSLETRLNTTSPLQSSLVQPRSQHRQPIVLRPPLETVGVTCSLDLSAAKARGLLEICQRAVQTALSQDTQSFCPSSPALCLNKKVLCENQQRHKACQT